MALSVRFNSSPRGFTYLELMFTIAILGSIFILSTYGLSRLQRSFTAQSVDREVVSILSSAARQARMGVQGGDWGVYIPYDNSSRLATSITLFHGATYATRVFADDRVYTVNSNAQFVSVDFSGPAADTVNDHEIVFSTLSGNTAQYGSIILTWYGQTRTIIIDPDGFAVRS